MTEKKTKKTKPSKTTTPPFLSPEAAECAKLLSNWNQSLTSFYIGRIQQYWKIPLDAQTVRSPGDLMEHHERFIGRLTEDYHRQAGKFLEIAQKEYLLEGELTKNGYEETILKAQADAAQIIEQAKVQADRILAAADAVAEQAATANSQPAEKTARRKSA